MRGFGRWIERYPGRSVGGNGIQAMAGLAELGCRGRPGQMQAGMDAMPEDFPPVVMFNNVAATRENSERILELLEEDRSGTEEPGD